MYVHFKSADHVVTIHKFTAVLATQTQKEQHCCSKQEAKELS